MDRPTLDLQILAELAELKRGQDELKRGQDELLELVRGLQRHRAALDAGRNKGNAESKRKAGALDLRVKQLAFDDLASGKQERGRAGRIALKIQLAGGEGEGVSVRTIKRRLDKQVSVSVSNVPYSKK